ncbi:MAG: hypothetical protein ACI9S8_003239 [Chlamydiales bacterium]|jgi:hypothetical protein
MSESTQRLLPWLIEFILSLPEPEHNASHVKKLFRAIKKSHVFSSIRADEFQ